jgi:hypothetical protein
MELPEIICSMCSYDALKTGECVVGVRQAEQRRGSASRRIKSATHEVCHMGIRISRQVPTFPAYLLFYLRE